jgi:hypothetical protein
MKALAGMGLVLLLMGTSSCGPDTASDQARTAPEPTYDPDTGRLTRLTADINGNGVIDAWTYMDGSLVLRTEVDGDEDGQIDRWELADERGRIVRTAWSRAKNGRADAWAQVDEQGRPVRAWMSAVGDESRPDRWEYYEAGALVRSEEDTSGRGRPDRWDTYEDGIVRTTAFDEDGDGRPDRRLTYDGNGQLLTIESDPDETGSYRQRREIAP